MNPETKTTPAATGASADNGQAINIPTVAAPAQVINVEHLTWLAVDLWRARSAVDGVRGTLHTLPDNTDRRRILADLIRARSWIDSAGDHLAAAHTGASS